MFLEQYTKFGVNAGETLDIQKIAERSHSLSVEVKRLNTIAGSHMHIAQLPPASISRGKPLHELSLRQARRKKAALKDNVEHALQGALQSLGLQPMSVTLVDESNPSAHISFSWAGRRPTGPQAMQYEESTILKSQTTTPKPDHLLEDGWHRVAEPYDGMYRSFKDKLLEVIEQLTDDTVTNGIANVKISGDGTEFSKYSNFTILLFCLLNTKNEIMMPKAIVRISETYEYLAMSLRPLLAEINDLLERKEIICSDGRRQRIDICLCGDLKFLLTILGFAQANSNHSCIWCCIHSNDRWDISITAEERTLEDIEKCASLTTKSRPVNTGIKHKPLIRVALRKVMVDELHLLLRSLDILMNNIIQHTAYQDELQGTRDPLSGPNLNLLVDTIRSLGVPFKVWKSRKTIELDWSSLGGN
eukprot:Em0008g1003a